MKKYERFFYFLVIVVEFILILLFYSALLDTKTALKKEIAINKRISPIIFSFNGLEENEKRNKTQEFYPPAVHFSAYSYNYYVFITFSPGCPQCLDMLDDFKLYFPSKKIDGDTFIYLLTVEEAPYVDIENNRSVFCMQIDSQDMVQFGNMTPSIFAVNGQGEILFKQIGYLPGVFDKALYAIQQNRNKNTRSFTFAKEINTSNRKNK